MRGQTWAGSEHAGKFKGDQRAHAVSKKRKAHQERAESFSELLYQRSDKGLIREQAPFPFPSLPF
jgi:hypothetical protein